MLFIICASFITLATFMDSTDELFSFCGVLYYFFDKFVDKFSTALILFVMDVHFKKLIIKNC